MEIPALHKMDLMNENIESLSICLPKIGESITEGTVVAWLKKVGDLVEKDEPLVEIATDKINTEIPSPAKGFLEEIIAPVNGRVEVGKPLCLLRQEALLQEETPFFSPAVLRIAQEHQISMSDLESIPRKGQRLSKKDLEQHLSAYQEEKIVQEGDKKIPMTPLRKTIAENMVRSFYEAPQASLVIEVDVTPILQIVEREKEAFFQEHQTKLTITPFFAKALIAAVKTYPLMNASVEGDTVIMKESVNLGIAVSVEEGIFVPIIKQASALSFVALSREIALLVKKTRQRALSADETENGSITLTNFGMGEVQIGIPILRYKEAAILGIGAIEKKVAVLENNSFGIRSKVHVSLTFDHRIIDGMYGCKFLQEIKQQLGSADRWLS
ncbi:MAG: dihydrolipoamide acetyltransferase family protein [Chlamydiota bacterium]